MLTCCGNPFGEIATTSKAQFLRQPPQPCRRHRGKPIKFICESCVQQPLLCEDCIADHKEHNWVSLQSFFNDDVVELFQKGQSKNGKVIEECVDRIVNNLVQYQHKIQKKVKEFVATVIIDLQKMKAKFPVYGGYHLSSNKLTNKTMGEVLRIISGERYVFDTARLEQTYDEIIGASWININDNLQLAKVTLSGHDWELLTEKQVLDIEANYLATYRKVPPNRKFYFSYGDRSKSISLENNRLTAVYKQQVPKFPVVLLDRYLSPDNHTVGFKITKLQTHFHFFNMSVIYIGLCHPTMAEGFSFLDIGKPSRGAYLISSKGMTYHSKLPEYHESNAAFSFSKGDIITVDLNIENGVVTFEKKTSVLPLLKKVEMRLDLQPKFITQLKPCVMFFSNPGAQVTILNETELQLEADGKVVYPVKDD